MTFKTKRVGDVIDEIAMGPFGSNIKVDCFVPSGIPVLNGSNLTGFTLTEETFNYVTPEKATSLKRAVAWRGDIVITHRGTLGQIVYIPADSKHEKYVISQSQFRVRCKETEMLPEFMVYFFHSREGKHQLLSNTSQVGVPALARPSSTFQELEMPVPTIAEQRVIVNTLSALDARIAENRKINHHLKKIAQAVFKSWFVDFEPFGGEMPVDWRVVEFSSFLTIRVGKSNDPSIPLFSVTDTGIYPRSDKFNKNLSKAETKNKIAYETDIVFGMSREILNWGIMRAPIGGVSSAYNVFAVASDINSKYLESFIKAHSFYFKDLIRPATREGQSVDKSALMLKSMYLPPDDVLAEYYAIEDSLTSEIQGNGKESAHLADLRDTLLPRLMSGELSVAEI